MPIRCSCLYGALIFIFVQMLLKLLIIELFLKHCWRMSCSLQVPSVVWLSWSLLLMASFFAYIETFHFTTNTDAVLAGCNLFVQRLLEIKKVEFSSVQTEDKRKGCWIGIHLNAGILRLAEYPEAIRKDLICSFFSHIQQGFIFLSPFQALSPLHWLIGPIWQRKYATDFFYSGRFSLWIFTSRCTNRKRNWPTNYNV